MARIFFLGTFIPEEQREKFLKLSHSLDYPGFVLQNTIFSKMTEFCDMTAIVVPSLKTRLRNCIIHSFEFLWSGANKNYSLGFVNVHGFKELGALRGGLKLFKKLGYKNDDTLFIYSIGTIPYLLAKVLKRRNKGLKVVSMITDLPEYMSDSRNLIYRLLKKVDRMIVNRCIENIDGFVLLSEHMRTPLSIESKPYIVVEGIYNNTIMLSELGLRKYNSEKEFVLYSGALSCRYGVDRLVDAFMRIKNSDYQLVLCGSGDAVEYIRECCFVDSRIVYLGVLPYNEVLFLQRKASLLVNPRYGKEEYTKYSFPSKTMEYLASGVPTLLYRLAGIPDEYYDYCFVIDECGVDVLAERIQEVLKLPAEERRLIGEKARNFVLNKKNSSIQVERILSFINRI